MKGISRQKYPSNREQTFLDKTYDTYNFKSSSQSQVIRDLAVETVRPFIEILGKKVGLQLGCADGFETGRLSTLLDELDVLEGSKKFLRDVRKKDLRNVNLIFSLFEEFRTPPRKKYDIVFATFVLEHVRDPRLLLRRIRSVLKKNGILYVVVPNARALSRQLALHMGILKSLYECTDNDLRHGHRRVLDRNTLNTLLAKSGFTHISQGGIMLKILADFQMDKLIDSGMLGREHLNGLYSLGLEYPDLSGSIYSVCKPLY